MMALHQADHGGSAVPVLYLRQGFSGFSCQLSRSSARNHSRIRRSWQTDSRRLHHPSLRSDWYRRRSQPRQPGLRPVLRRLDRNVAAQELDLIQFAASEAAKTSARAPHVVRGRLVDAGASHRGAHHVPQHLGRHAGPQIPPALLIARNTRPGVMAAAAVYTSTVLFTHVGRARGRVVRN